MVTLTRLASASLLLTLAFAGTRGGTCTAGGARGAPDRHPRGGDPAPAPAARGRGAAGAGDQLSTPLTVPGGAGRGP